MRMKRSTGFIVVASLLAGMVITLLFTAQMDWKQQGDCSSHNQMRPQSIRRVDCSSLEYGYPFHFISSQPSVDISALTLDHASPALLGISAVIKLDPIKLAADIFIWSAASLAVLSFFNTPRKDRLS